MKNRKLPQALILALADPVKEKKLESICERLKACGKTKDYCLDKETTYLEFVSYGIDGIKFSRINTLFEKEN